MANSPEQFSEQDFWQKIKLFAVQAGKEVVEKALTLYFAAQRPETPLWAKTVIYSALVYFIVPTDAIPDFAPFAGYADDLGTLITALGTVALCITPEVKEAARQKVDEWFGNTDTTTAPSENSAPRTISIE
jgi:uncharacterized membrane protein YkvA (DUF1232 family)